jgi:hypothetical protein
MKSPQLRCSILIILFVSAGCIYPVTERQEQETIVFVGKLLAKSPPPEIDCGGLHIHQIARYSVERVIIGNLQQGQIVVDHSACYGDVFQGIAVEEQVKVSVSKHKDNEMTTCYPGIREYGDKPKLFYVALTPPEKLNSEK